MIPTQPRKSFYASMLAHFVLYSATLIVLFILLISEIRTELSRSANQQEIAGVANGAIAAVREDLALGNLVMARARLNELALTYKDVDVCMEVGKPQGAPIFSAGKSEICGESDLMSVAREVRFGAPDSAPDYLVDFRFRPHILPVSLSRKALAVCVALAAILFLGTLAIFSRFRRFLLAIEGAVSDERSPRPGAGAGEYEEVRQVRELAIASRNAARFKKVAEIAFQVAHDIRSPLAALNVVLSDLDGVPEERKSLMREATARIRRIASDLLQQNRAAPTDPRIPVRISPLLDGILEQKQAEWKNLADVRIAFERNGVPDDLEALCEPDRLIRIVSNVVNNAVEALPERGEVILRLYAEGRFAVLEIHDTGRGIPTELLPRLGQRGVTYGKETGNGLGLADAREALEAWGGELRIDSELGHGTTVRLHLPLRA